MIKKKIIIKIDFSNWINNNYKWIYSKYLLIIDNSKNNH